MHSDWSRTASYLTIITLCEVIILIQSSNQENCNKRYANVSFFTEWFQQQNEFTTEFKSTCLSNQTETLFYSP